MRVGSGLLDACPICLVEYSANDEVAELNCDERHCFHARCLDDWLRVKLECPLCKRPVNAAQPIPSLEQQAPAIVA
jgi:hypothetical protein